MSAILFYLCAALMLGLAMFVVLNRNPMYSVVALVFSLANLAILYFLLEAYFIGALQILVYAGAIMVLFLFVVMLLGVQPEKSAPGIIKFQSWWFGVAAALFFGLILLIVGGSAKALKDSATDAENIGTVAEIGSALFSKYLLPFEMASLLLLVALVGTVYLAKRRI